MALKEVVIVGLSQTTHGDVPWEKPDIWGLPWDEGYWRRFSRLFEMHDLSLIRDVPCRPVGYEDRLRSVEVPLYMQEQYFPEATRYPFEAVAETTTDYFNSSIGYMLALAIHEQYERISIFGVDMKADDEYGYQKPNAEYLIGLARGRGIEVLIPEASPLCKFQGSGIKFGKSFPIYRTRYGRL